MNVNDVARRGSGDAGWRSGHAIRLGALHFDFDKVVEPVLAWTTEDFAHDPIDDQYGIVSRLVFAILAHGSQAPKSAKDCRRDDGADARD